MDYKLVKFSPCCFWVGTSAARMGREGWGAQEHTSGAELQADTFPWAAHGR